MAALATQTGTTNPPNPTYVSILLVQKNNPNREIGSMLAAICVILRQISQLIFWTGQKS